MPFLSVFGFEITARDETGPGIQSAIAGSTRLEQAQSRVTDALKGGAREMSMLASAGTHMGMVLMLAAPQLGEFAGVVGQAGALMGGFGAGISAVVPLLQTMKVVLYGDLIPAVVGYTAALWDAYAAEIAITGGAILVVGAITAWYFSTQRATDGAKDLGAALKGVKEAFQDLDSAQKKYYGIQEDLTDIQRDYDEAVISGYTAHRDYLDAVANLNDLQKKGVATQRDLEDASIAVEKARLRDADAQDRIAHLAGDIVELQGKQNEATKELLVTETTYNKAAIQNAIDRAKGVNTETGNLKTNLTDREKTTMGHLAAQTDMFRQADQAIMDDWATVLSFLGRTPTAGVTSVTAPQLAGTTINNPNIKGPTYNITVNNPVGKTTNESILRALGGDALQGGI